MALTQALSSAISKGFYVSGAGDKVSYKKVFIDLFTYAKTHGYLYTIRQLTLKYNYVDRKLNEIQSRIDAAIQDMDSSSYSDEYDIFLSFLQSNMDADSVNMPVFNTTNLVLSNRIISLKNLYHDRSVLSYKRELFMTMITNLTKNRDSLDTILVDLQSI